MSLTLPHREEMLCWAHIQALAGMAGINVSVFNFDYGVDGQFSPIKKIDTRRVTAGHPLDFQAKASINWKTVNGEIIYDLESKTYNDIVRRDESETTLILILLCLPKDQSYWHQNDTTCTTLRNACYWHIIKGNPTANAFKTRIGIPVANLLTPKALEELMEAERARRQRQAT